MSQTIPLIEDNAVNRRLAQFLSNPKGTRWEAMTALGSLATFAERRPDLFPADIQLPEVDGLTATRHLRPILPPDIPVGRDVLRHERTTRALEAGAAVT
jgi:CheY-like chemotaxis protein